MIGRALLVGEWSILQELSKGRRKVSELRQVSPLYGSAFDLALSELLVNGLVRRITEGGEEYVELTELGKNITTVPWWAPGMPGMGPWGMWGWRRGRYHGYWW